jgi:hypothetical protein
MRQTRLRLWTAVLALGGAALGFAYGPFSVATASASNDTFHVAQILLGSSMHHTFTASGSTSATTDTLTKPDDISHWGDLLFVAFQNGVGPQGEASADGNLDSTVVELTTSGHVIAQWDLLGKVDGLSVDPDLGVLATVNEDFNSSLYLIRPNAPASGQVTHFSYAGVLAHGGGTDAIAVDHGRILVSASAPGTNGSAPPQPTYPAVYSVTLNENTKVASLTPLFFDESSATNVNVGGPLFGTSTPLALTDPDSSEMVPGSSRRFAGDFMLTSQGDQAQVFVRDAGTSHQQLSVLTLSQAVDDTAWATKDSGSLFTTDSTNDAVDVVTGPFERNQPIVVATPCGANSAPSTCPAPNYPVNYMATLNLVNGTVTPVTVTGSPYVPQGGLTFVPDDGHDGDQGDQGHDGDQGNQGHD